MPELFIIAGPNGAGKSIFSNTLVSTPSEVFDGDKYVSELKQKYPETGSDVLQEHVNEHIFKEAKDKAIKAGENFAFETNFSSPDPVKSLREFKNNGYQTHLIFIGLNSIEECIQRVSQRVKSGGHKVSEESIVFNFEKGLSNLYTYFNSFDTVTLFDNGIASNTKIRIPVKVLQWKNGKIDLYLQHFPAWMKTFIESTQ